MKHHNRHKKCSLREVTNTKMDVHERVGSVCSVRPTHERSLHAYRLVSLIDIQPPFVC